MPNPARTIPRDSEQTRARILTSAVTLFAARGFEQTGIRDIAADAGTSGALVVRYFGSKEGLFRSALEASTLTEAALPTDPAQAGAHVAALFAVVDDVPNPLAMMLLSAGNAEARAISLDLLERRVLEPLAAYLGGPDAAVRAAQLQMLWSGFLVGQRLLPLPVMAGADRAEILHWLAAQTQAIVDRGRQG